MNEAYYIGSRIWEIDWYQNKWPWPLFRGHINNQGHVNHCVTFDVEYLGNRYR